MFLAILPLAAADQEDVEACSVSYVKTTLPFSGQGGVPTDARLVAFVSDGCDGPGRWTLEVSRVRQEAQASSSLDSDAGGSVRVLEPPDGLEPDARYELEAIPRDEGQAAEVLFCTCATEVVGLDGAPVATLGDANWADGVLRIPVDVDPVADPDGLSWIEVTLDGMPVAAWPASAGMSFLPVLEDRERQEEVCVEVSQVDGRGDRVFAEPACGEVRRVCATGGSSASWLSTLALLSALRRRPLTAPRPS